MILAAPALVARIEFSGAHSLAPYLREWLWASIASPLLAVALVRLVLFAEGRLRSRSVPAVKRWLGLLARAAIMLGVINVVVSVQEIHAATAEAKRALSRVHAENERVRRQAEQVQTRLAKLRVRTAGPADRSTDFTGGRARDKKNERRQL
ncbi:hypothetical protein IQ63_44070 [Streptomyces acidiscabies]|uniref:Uncharacterized protein n=2 Tax=Streptomyces acidiscabies TaxID=42234 RepID=A0A0L0JD52_9ACTN|nr:hypothetical protein IQ63_44070 [Streptomyces acidiscabies]